MGASQLASVLETKYCLMEGTEVDSGTSTIGCGISTSDSQPETTLSVSEQMVHIQQPGAVHIQESKSNYK